MEGCPQTSERLIRFAHIIFNRLDTMLCLLAATDEMIYVPPILQIRTIDRVCEIPHEGPFCDLMWSDPEEIDTWAISPRGAGWLFGRKVATEFNQINGETLGHGVQIAWHLGMIDLEWKAVPPD